jgi:hypothetical protein
MSATVIPFPTRPEPEPLAAPGRVWVTAQFIRDGLRGVNLPGVESVDITSRFI